MARHLDEPDVKPMPRLKLVESKQTTKINRNPGLPEGVSAKQLLEANGYVPRTQSSKNGQFEFPCPFHEEPGTLGKTEPTKFYVNAKTSQYYCQHSSCQESGNLQSLEKYFGVHADPTMMSRFKSKELQLQEFEAAMTDERRDFLRTQKGLTDATITKFRIGWNLDKNCYVIPYLEFRRPLAFRFYDPFGPVDENDQPVCDEKGRRQYGGPNGSKYWWENANDSIVSTDESVLRLFNPDAAVGDAVHGRVFVCEGELKAMLLDGAGFHAVSIPGVNSFKREWAQYFMKAKEVVVLMDSDDPDYHKSPNCRKCNTTEVEDCGGHNVGQEGAARLVDFFGYRARNAVLPIPEGERKTDINEFLIRDQKTWLDFEKVLEGRDAESKYLVRTLKEIRENPPPEAVFLVSNGLLPRGGRLLVTGAPKVGKSIWVENLVLSIASGVPFLDRFPIANTGLTPGHRVLLLDRELSKRALLDRLDLLTKDKPSYQVAEEKLFVDHDARLVFDQPNAASLLINLINVNNAEVVVFDTAYKFFGGGDFESSRSLMKVFAVLDQVITETGVSMILTHHQKKGSNAPKNDGPHIDSVAGSFLWTGWVNGTVLLNFKNRSVADPYTTVCAFDGFRDAAAPDPLLLKRSKDSISYKEITSYSFDDLTAEVERQNGGGGRTGYQPRPKLTFDSLADLLMTQVPTEEQTFLHQASAHFGMKAENIRIKLLEILDSHPDFVRDGKGSTAQPYVWRYRHDVVEAPYEADHLDENGQFKGQTSITELLG